MSEHLNEELIHLKRRNEIKRQLLQSYDFSKQKAFNLISNNEEKINMDYLVEFLKKYGNIDYPRQTELEAILRRCDHEGD